jgi:hypothetical protein
VYKLNDLLRFILEMKLKENFRNPVLLLKILAHFVNHKYCIGYSPRVIRFTSPSTVRESNGQGVTRVLPEMVE